MIKPLFTGSEWNTDVIDNAMGILDGLAPELKLNTYPNQLEIITSEQMVDAYTSVGLPIMYKHWSFGKRFTREKHNYKTGRSGLAYELVLNTDPCINFLMEENTATTQVLVLAHAAYGHNHVFKNNYLFRDKTDASSIIEYLNFAKNFITECEEKYGREDVEQTLDAAHALMTHGIDKIDRPAKLNVKKEKARQEARKEHQRKQVNELWSTVPAVKSKNDTETPNKRFLDHPEENILYFLEKKAPNLKDWQREILRIVRKIAQYFEPQRLTKTLNEGWASFTHFYMMNRLWDEGHLTDGSMIEFLKLHTSVMWQPPYDSDYYSGINPYYMGIEIFTDIRRMCTEPTKEDEEYFPNLVGTDWVDACLDAVENYNDESFIRQFLSPHLCRKMRLFQLQDDNKTNYKIGAIHDQSGFKQLRRTLADSHLADQGIPKIEVFDVDLNRTRKLTLKYYATRNRKLSSSAGRVIKYIEQLWGFPVMLIDQNHQEIATG